MQEVPLHTMCYKKAWKITSQSYFELDNFLFLWLYLLRVSICQEYFCNHTAAKVIKLQKNKNLEQENNNQANLYC